MHNEPTVISSWVSIGLQAFAIRGVSIELACKHANVLPEQLNNPFTPIPLSQVTALWNYAEGIINNPCFGLESAKLINFTTFHSLGYAILASANLYDAFMRITDYSNAATNIGYTFLTEHDDRFIFGIKVNPDVQNLPDGCLDMTLAIFRFMCRLIHDEKPNIITLEMPRKTLHNRDIFSKVFTSNILLDRDKYALHFDKQYLLKPIPTANEAVANANDKFVEELILKTQYQSVSYQVRKTFRDFLIKGNNTTIESVAYHINMSERNLQRCLKQESTTFRELLDYEKKKLARQMLKESKVSVCDIAHQLGFSDSANFSRAFRRWFNCKPLSFRENKINDLSD